jgi:hypothetical protein
MNCLAIISIFGTILVYGLNQLCERVMQDFTKPLVVAENLPKVQAKWLNKDRLWNFVFWFGMSFGMAVTMSVSKEQQAKYSLGTILIWATMICIPLLVRHFSKTSFIKKDTFANSEGVVISKKQMPYSFSLAGMSGLGIAFIVAELFFPKGKLGFASLLAMYLSLFSGISLYFIFKNCPISILFNLKYWELRSTERRKSSGNDDHHAKYTKSCRDRMNSPVYQNLPQNVHYRHR